MIIERTAPEGNVFGIMGLVHRLLRETGRQDEWPSVSERMQSGDYDNACRVAHEVSFGSIEFTDDGEPVEFN